MTTDTTATAPAIPTQRADLDQAARMMLAGYPHIAGCHACLGYTRDHVTELRRSTC